jgi:hypothetical protein
MSATAARDAAATTARTDARTARQQARRIADPWFRCQALAWAARYAAEPEFDAIAAEALKAASDSDDPYRVVAASAWPVRAMVERGRSGAATKAVAALLPVAARIEHPVSRGYALHVLWEAVYAVKPAAKDVLRSLVSACQAMYGWQGPFLLRNAALTLAADDPAAARSVIAAMPDGPLKRQAERRVAAGESSHPRPFFWQGSVSSVIQLTAPEYPARSGNPRPAPRAPSPGWRSASPDGGRAGTRA